MRQYEWERAKPMLWAMFAAAASVDPRTNNPAEKADSLLGEFERRFPVEADDDA